MTANTEGLLARLASERARQVSATLAKQTSINAPGMINLASGTPDFPTPPHVVEAGQRAIAEGKTVYTAWAGLPALREAIAEQLRREKGLSVDPLNEIIVTAGSQAAMLTVTLALLDPGDEVLVPTPFYDEYRRDIMLAGATMIPVPTRLEDNFEVDPDALERAVTPRTKAMILISPSNPTGAVMERGTLERIAAIAQRHDLLVIWDELYERFVYDGFQHVSLASLPGMWERTVVINGFSKCYGMTGWRIGYVAARREIADALLPIAHGMTICAPSMAQYAALAAITGPTDWFDEILAEYDRRRRLWMQALDAMGLPYGRPRGAYYIMPNISGTGLTSQQFAKALREEGNLMIGGAGGATDPFNEGFVRCSLATSYTQLEQGLERMAAVVKKYKG
jgi:aminotransferase